MNRHVALTKSWMLLDALTAIPTFLASPALRPWHMRWGARNEEVVGAMPGDDVVPRAQFNATRAITIGARPDGVWPWIVQLGYGRAGFYTYDLLDNGCMRSADSILGQHQILRPGDFVPMFHDSRGLSVAYCVDSLEAPKWMLWVHRPHPGQAPDSTWSWQLTELPGGRTRLVTRMKQDYRWETPRLAAFNLVLMELGDFAMERRMLRSIRARAERASINAVPPLRAARVP